MRTDDPIARLMQAAPVTAGGFIVTVYGDVVVPRGGVLWIGSLIELCARIGISETLVRTAVSRLVAAERLEGARIGRRSFYRLAEPARAEFAEAARRLYAPPPGSGDWTILFSPDLPETLVRHHRLAPLGEGVWIAPPSGGVPEGEELVLRATALPGGDPRVLGRLWPLDALAEGYRRFLAAFAALDHGAVEAPDQALSLRLLLVHHYRAVLLKDPGLPPEALPEDWPGKAAQMLFRRLYQTLTPAAEAQIPHILEGEGGPLPAATSETRARLAALG